MSSSAPYNTKRANQSSDGLHAFSLKGRSILSLHFSFDGSLIGDE